MGLHILNGSHKRNGANPDTRQRGDHTRVWSRLATWLLRFAPWLMAALVLWFLFRQVPLMAAWQAMDQARFSVFLPVILITTILTFWVESSALAQLFSRFNAPVAGGEARSLRALTYLLTPINWNLGTGAMVLHLRTSKDIGAIESTSSLIFYSLIDGLFLSGIVFLGVLTLCAFPVLQTIGRFAAVSVVGHLGVFVFCMSGGLKWRWVQRIKSLPPLRTFCLATWQDIGVLLGMRAIYFAVIMLSHWATTATFNVHVPLAYMTVAVPIILLVSSLPITPAGLGTQQAASLLLFSPYGSEANILAYSLIYPVASLLMRLFLGLFYLRDLKALRCRHAQNPS